MQVLTTNENHWVPSIQPPESNMHSPSPPKFANRLYIVVHWSIVIKAPHWAHQLGDCHLGVHRGQRYSHQPHPYSYTVSLHGPQSGKLSHSSVILF